MDLQKLLNPVQRQAVLHGDGPLLILAGAGSGKTRVLTYRVAHLVRERKVSPSAILAITFTNKAAKEMQERLQRLLPEAPRLFIATFHAACLRILKKDGSKVGLAPNFVVYDTADQAALMRECLRELNLDQEKFSPQSIIARISMAKNSLQSPADFAAQRLDYFESTVSDAYFLYEKKLRQYGAVDFDDLLLLVVRLLSEHQEVREYYQHKFQYILVDEYQDTNIAQYKIVKALAAKHRNLSVVGDDDQSIYRWRGANLQNILDFEKDYPEATVYKLEQNYRSTKVILEAANAVIAQNVGRKEKALWTDNNVGEPATVFAAQTEQEEAYYIAHTIAEQLVLYDKYEYSDCAVLYRTHAQSRALEDALIRLGVPYRVIGGQRFYDRKEVKDLLAYLRLIVNPSDDVSFNRVINVPRRGLGDVTLEKLAALAAHKQCSLLHASQDADELTGVRTNAIFALKDFAAKIVSLSRQSEFLALPQLVEEVLATTGLRASLMEQGRSQPDAIARLENVMEVISVARDFEEANPENNSLSDFLSTATLVTQGDEDDAKTGGSFVSLMSLHSAKGLEFPVVFLSGLEEGIFPHMRTLYDAEELEEERRLCYVGLTRAREKLYLTHALQRMLYGRLHANGASRFLEDIPAACVVRRGGKREALAVAATSLPPAAHVVAAEEVRQERLVQSDFSPADRVRHPKFGEGTVVSVNKKADDVFVSVAFLPPFGIKTLALSFAPLEKLR
ncbi:MAG: DNA helicase PcrA [Thermaerobacter sp.]|nr:DNA helicase PcrA [Thermaerobacter sp.]